MDIPAAFPDGRTFGERHFGAAKLGSVSRTNRLVDLANLMLMHPGGTLPQKLNAPADLKAIYRLMDDPRVTHDAVFAPHAAHTREVVGQVGGTVLLVHDTTELDFTTKYSLEGLGQIGKGTHNGYLCHHSLAINPTDRNVLGLTSQILHVRPPKKKRKVTLKKHREDPNRESLLWIDGFDKSGAPPTGVRYVHVCDRGADTFEVFAALTTRGDSFVIRSTHDRALTLPEDTPTGTPKYLHQFARQLPALGTKTMAVQENFARRQREATVGIAAAQVTLTPPQQRRGEYPQVPLTMWVVRVWELQPPPFAVNEKPLEWILLTAEPCADLAATEIPIAYYECRPIVEELHKAQKTGCNIESMQFNHVDRLQPAIALQSVVALSLLQLRDASRRPDAKVRPATEIIDREYVDLLCLWRHGTIEPNWSVHDFYMAMARLGGHQNRRGDHRPGWLILWRGMTKLQAMVSGAELQRRRRKKLG